MALLKKNNLRGSSIIALTNVQLALLTAKDFNLTCQLYPRFEKKMNELASERERNNRPHEIKEKVESSILNKFMGNFK
jgi:CRP-like cAMP-binding protein